MTGGTGGKFELFAPAIHLVLASPELTVKQALRERGCVGKDHLKPLSGVTCPLGKLFVTK
jgi:hypothetical protein